MPVTFSPSTGGKSRTAVIVIDFQNEFVRPNGKLHGDVEAVMKETGMLQKVPHVVRAARESGALVIHSPVVIKSGDKFAEKEEFDPHSYGAMKGLFVEGTWNCEFADEVQPQGSDIILKNRKNFSAFQGTELQTVLESNEIEKLFVAGFLSDVCVTETTRECSELFPDMNIYVCLDGCAAKTKQDHYVAVGSTLPLFSNVISCSEAQDLLKVAPPSGKVFVASSTEAEKEGLLQRPVPEWSYRPRILALHGAQSNNAVTKLQLENLHITEEDYDIFYLHGSIEESEIHPSLEGLVKGPFYSWFDKESSKENSSLITAVKDVVSAVKHHGPFDGIYGFSSGGVVAALAANLTKDPTLQDAVKNTTEGHRFSQFGRFSVRIRIGQTLFNRNSQSNGIYCPFWS